MASEEVGNADPRALTLCLDAWESWRRLGSPEGDLALAQAAVYVASCPKSNAVYAAHNESLADAKKLGSLDVPMHLRNAPTTLMKNQGFGDGYQYDHDNADSVAYSQKGFPDKMGEKVYYQPKQAGLEIKIAKKLDMIRSKRND
jgi:putative ATPase